MKEIKITCKGALNLNYKLLTPFQGNLKDLSKENYEKLKKSIIKYGFSEPCSVWLHDQKYYILNSHQRIRTITEMIEKEGYFCPDLPCSLIEAKDIKEAKKKVLALTSQYGQMTGNGLYEFILENDLNLDELEQEFRFPELNINKFKTEFFDEIKTEDIINENDPMAKDQFIVAVQCKNENEMKQIYEELSQRGLSCKLIM